MLLYSIGKDSSVLLELARRAFAPGPIPLPLLHIDTGYKFREMIEFRDQQTARLGASLVVRRNREAAAEAMRPDHAHTDEYVYYKKTKPLLEAIAEFGFDAAIGGARREEEKARAKERVFSLRGLRGGWTPKNQRPELWHLYNTRLAPGESMRVFPLSNWTELDIWRYIRLRQIDVVPLYFAEKRRVSNVTTSGCGSTNSCSRPPARRSSRWSAGTGRSAAARRPALLLRPRARSTRSSTSCSRAASPSATHARSTTARSPRWNRKKSKGTSRGVQIRRSRPAGHRRQRR